MESVAPARETRDAHRRKAEREAREVLVSAGLQSHPLAKLIARQIARLECGASRCEARAMARGYWTKDGTPSAAFTKLTSLTADLLGEARRLLETMAGTVAPPPREVLHRIVIEDDLDPTDDDRSGDPAGDVQMLVAAATRPNFSEVPRESLQAQIADGRLADLPPAQTLDDDLAALDEAHTAARRDAETTDADALTELDTPHSEAPAANWADVFRPAR